jgi:tRNA threonylcarbamoyladenosine biosynthesis protein TsaB
MNKNNVNILGLDLSTNNCSVALLYNGQIKEIAIASNILRAQKLLSMINELLKENQVELNKLTLLAFGAGPGSFTGLKIASSVIQGLHLTWQKPIIKISSLWALALQGYEQFGCEYIMPCIDAKMGQVYYGIYGINSNEDSGFPILIQEDSLAEPKDIKISNNSILVVGDGAHLLQQKMLLGLNQKLKIEPTVQYVQASSIVKLAEYLYNKFDNVIVNNADPFYLKLYD